MEIYTRRSEWEGNLIPLRAPRRICTISTSALTSISMATPRTLQSTLTTRPLTDPQGDQWHTVHTQGKHVASAAQARKWRVKGYAKHQQVRPKAKLRN
jgi:hypothetical protein